MSYWFLVLYLSKGVLLGTCSENRQPFVVGFYIELLTVQTFCLRVYMMYIGELSRCLSALQGEKFVKLCHHYVF